MTVPALSLISILAPHNEAPAIALHDIMAIAGDDLAHLQQLTQML